MMDITITGADAAVLYDSSLRRYVTGFYSTFGIAVICGGKTFFITDARYLEAAKKYAKADKVLAFNKEYPVLLLKELGVKRVGLCLDKTSATQFLQLQSAGFEPVDISDELYKQFAVKCEKSLKYIKKACNIAENAYKKLLFELKEGITERQAANRLEGIIKELGAEDKSFDTIVAFGKNSAVPHHATGETKLKNGMAVLIDFGCKYKGHCSDMTRTLYFGSPSQEYLNAYLAVLNAYENAELFIKSGTKAGEADALARDILKTKGLDKYFTHSLGHGMGYDIHEYPYLKTGSGDILKDGMVFSIEPGVYFEGKFGIRLENSVCISGGTAVSLIKYTMAPVYIENGTVKTIKTFKNIIDTNPQSNL